MTGDSALIMEPAATHPIPKLEEEEEEEEEQVATTTTTTTTTTTPSGATAAKKKKRKNKKKAAAAGATPTNADAQAATTTTTTTTTTTNAPPLKQQTSPPSIPIRQLYQKGHFPHGEECEYTQEWNTFRTTNAELREKERLLDTKVYDDVRLAAVVHRTTRKWARSFMRPGLKMIDITDKIEQMNRQLVEAKGLECGWAFPTGCSLNHVAAHYTPNPGDQTVLGKDDVCKIDFGVHVNGRIIDSAFTVHFNPMFDPLVQSTKEATNTGVKLAGIDVRLSELGAAIEEVISSYEVEIRGKTYRVRPVRNLGGHSIGQYRIHNSKFVPLVANRDHDAPDDKMEEGEFYAIETFASTGRGYIEDGPDCSHYMKNYNRSSFPTPKTKGQRDLLKYLDDNYGTLCWCRKWIERDGWKRYLLDLKGLMDLDIIHSYPPLCDIKGSYVSQWEHTLVLKPTRKEVLSRGEDY